MEFVLHNDGHVTAYDMFAIMRPDSNLILDEVIHHNAILLIKDHGKIRKITHLSSYASNRYIATGDELMFELHGYLTENEITRLRSRTYNPSLRNPNMCLDLWSTGTFYNCKASAAIVFYDIDRVTPDNSIDPYRHWKSMTKYDNQDIVDELE